jgi:GT2 family glycosyltransferase
MLFSIIVNSYNRVNNLEKTLHSLTQLRWPEFEIIVITGPSEDGSLALIEQWLPKIKHAVCPFANLARSRNQGLALSSGEWIAFIDDDAMPEPDWLCRLAAYAHEPRLGALGGFVIDHTGKQYQSQYLVSNQFGKTKNYTDLLQTPLFSASESEYYPSLMGVNTCFRRKALEDIGGFDQAYAYYLEETDIIFRLHKKQWQTRCIPDALVHHKFADSHIRHEHIVTSLYHIIRSRTYFACRHALAKQGLAAYAKYINADLAEMVQYQDANQRMETGISATTLQNESYTALLDGLKIAQETADIPVLNKKLPAPLRFQAILNSDQRLHFCLVSRSYPPQAMGGVARFIQTLAKALVKMGHEVSVIAETQHKNATIDWENGVWVHRIKALTRAEKQQLKRPSDMPNLPESIDAFAAAVWKEVHEYHPRRQFHAALGSIWDLDMAWLIGSQSLPIWMYLVTSYHQMQDKADWQTAERYTNLLQPMLVAEKWALQNCHILASTQAIARDTAELTQLANIAHSKIIPFGLERLLKGSGLSLLRLRCTMKDLTPSGL